MPYPANIRPVVSRLDCGDSPHYSAIFRNGSNLYVVICENGVMYTNKSTDAGLSWSRVDTANGPDPYDDAFGNTPTFAVGANGTRITVAYNDQNAPDTSIYHKSFDMATDTWGSATSGGPLLDKPLAGSHKLLMYVIARSGGELVFLYASTVENVAGTNYARASYVRWSSGGGWSSATQVAGQSGVARHFMPCGITVDSGNRIHLFIASTTHAGTNPSDARIDHVTLNSSNVEGTVQQILTDLYRHLYSNVAQSVSPAIIYNDGSERVALAYGKNVIIGNLDTQNIYVATAAVADNPTWSSEVAVTTGTPWSDTHKIKEQELVLLYYQNVLHVFAALCLDSDSETVIVYTKKAASPTNWITEEIVYIPDQPYRPEQFYASSVPGGIGMLQIGSATLNGAYGERAQYYLFVPGASSACMYYAY